MKLESNKNYMVTINFTEMTLWQRIIFAYQVITKKWSGLRTDVVEITNR